MVETIPALNEVDPNRIRLRERKRDYMFGGIWRDLKKSLKNATSNSTKVVFQILDYPESLTDNQIVVILKKRNREKRIYEDCVELIFEAGKTPSVEELMEAAQKKIECEVPIKLVKYFHYDFEWVEISRENIDKVAKGRKKGSNKQKKGNKNEQKGKNKEKEHKP